MEEKEYFHAVYVDKTRCTGCTRCVRVCPTEAIRVREKTAIIDSQKCVDCGLCIEACSFGAIKTLSDPLSSIENYPYKVAIISSSYFGQFTEDIDYKTARKALYQLGFNTVITESALTKILIDIKRNYILSHPEIRPILSSNCPAVVRLIQVRFPSLLPNLLHIEAPLSMLSVYYREKISDEKNMRPEDIGVFLIVPCIAQVTAVHQPEGAYKTIQEGAISIIDVYNKVRDKLKDARNLDIQTDEFDKGISWALSGLEADGIDNEEIRTLDVSGINNVIDILMKIENHLLDQYDYIVLRNCTYGCVGGSLNVESPFIAASRIKKFAKGKIEPNQDLDELYQKYEEGLFDVLPLEPRSIMELDKDIKLAIQKMKKVKEIMTQLPDLDCGACGSPTCKALAEDIVQGTASLNDCIVRLKELYEKEQKKE